MTDLQPDALKARLDSETRSRSAPLLRPVDAATLILLDGLRGRKRPKVLMGKRSPTLKFMPGKFVFPGGRVDPGDGQMLAAGALSPRAEMRLMSQAPRLTPSRCRAIAMAAIRETFEETGLMIGSAGYGKPERAPAGVWREFADQGLFPTPDALVFVARAITPPRRPRRFDTRFFAAPLESVGGRVERAIGPDAELTELVWIDIDEATSLDLPTITQVVLAELKDRIAAGLDKDLPVPFYYERHRRFRRDTV
jgi:8-oxo-dGTP pyrophosphatase MutT (NUDIX family)